MVGSRVPLVRIVLQHYPDTAKNLLVDMVRVRDLCLQFAATNSLLSAIPDFSERQLWRMVGNLCRPLWPHHLTALRSSELHQQLRLTRLTQALPSTSTSDTATVTVTTTAVAVAPITAMPGGFDATCTCLD